MGRDGATHWGEHPASGPLVVVRLGRVNAKFRRSRIASQRCR